jgi:hypothetical protein
MGTAFIQFQKKLFIAGLVLLFGPVAARADDALLEVLRHNKLITEDQYQTLRKAREKERAKLDRPLPAQDQDILDVLLANGLISQAQFADLRVKAGAAKKVEQEAKPSLTEGFKVSSQDKSFQAQAGVYFQMDHVHDENDPREILPTAEGINIGDVGGRILGDEGRLAVTRGLCWCATGQGESKAKG